MSSRQGKAAKHGGRAGAKKHQPQQASAPASDAAASPNAAALAATLREILTAQGVPERALAALPTQLEAAPPGQWPQIVLDELSARLHGEALRAALAMLLAAPLDPTMHEQAIRVLEHDREPAALEMLVRLGEQGGTRTIRRAAKASLFRLEQSGLTVPASARPASPSEDVSSWPVERAWANRIDNIGSQAVGLARRRPHGGLAFISVIISDDRGVVDAMGESGTSPRALDRLTERLALPPGAPLYDVPPEYVRYRIRQGLATSQRAGRTPAADFRRWSLLLDGIDDTWDPDLEGLCRRRARPEWLERTAILTAAVEYMDWWPDPDAGSGAAVMRFIHDVEAALNKLPYREQPEVLPRQPPYLQMLAETNYIAGLWPYDAEESALIEALIDRHIEKVLPPPQRKRMREALLQMGYLAEISRRPTLCTLIMTAAWALGPDAPIDVKEHPFLRQLMRKAIELLLAV